MRNCLILGCGRSGTSLTAALAQQAGYFLGEPLQPPNAGNPLGRFESFEVNAINEALLAQVLPHRTRRWFDRLFRRHVPLHNQRWLAEVPVGCAIPGAPALTARMAVLTARAPYCFKDPRFSYTLPAWRPALAETCFVCVFRHPVATADSILRERAAEPGLRTLALNRQGALRVWTLMYRHILEQHRHSGEWLFIHYEQMLFGQGVERLGEFLGASLDPSLVAPGLRRSRAIGPAPGKTRPVYAHLCALAGWEGP